MVPEGWKTYKLNEISSKIGDGLHGTPIYDELGVFYFINGSNLVHGKIEVNSDTKRVNEEEYKKYKKELSDRTILIGINGTIGNLALYNNEKCILGKSAAYINVNEEFDKEFLKYVLLNDHFQEYIKINATGTTIKNVGLALLREYEFKAPQNIKIQRRIGSILSSLDDRIELNLQMNKTLEAFTQAIFKEWFVDFRFPGFDGELVDGLPKGWRQSTLSEIVINIKKPVSVNNRNKYAFYLPLDSIDRKSMTLINSEPVGKANSSLIEFLEDDILFGAMRSYFHKVIIAPFKGLTRTTCFVFRPIRPEYLYYIYLKCFQEESVTYSNKTAKGTTMPYAVWEGGMASMPLLIPPLEVCKEFNYFVEPVFNRIKMTFFLNRILIELRDSLLPNLITGKIRVE